MRHSCVRGLAAAALLIAAALTPASASEGSARDKLWHIVTSCIVPTDADYCRRCATPRADSACAQNRRCEDTTEVWGETDEFVAIRDVKMCSCPAGFVHGLALPRARVRGIEASPLPQGIWAFAWGVAQGKIAEESTIALVVNSVRTRTQDQLHVHLVRLREDARQSFSGRTASVPRLDEVWTTASQLAADRPSLKDYSVLVARDLKGAFMVLVESNDKSVERAYTQRICR
jgi:CDP-diacylglycerol pyrophosphatase